MKLHAWLAQNEKTPTWLAEKTGLSISYVSRLAVEGKLEKSPSLETCALISAVTRGEVTANDFMPKAVPKKRGARESDAVAA